MNISSFSLGLGMVSVPHLVLDIVQLGVVRQLDTRIVDNVSLKVPSFVSVIGKLPLSSSLRSPLITRNPSSTVILRPFNCWC